MEKLAKLLMQKGMPVGLPGGKPEATPLAAAPPEKTREPANTTSWWRRLPQLLNLALYHLKSSQDHDTLDYDPLHLHLSPAEVHPRLTPKANGGSPVKSFLKRSLAQRIDLDSFRFMMDQMPGLLSIEFFGHQHDPLETPDLLEMVKYAARFNGAECILKTNGLLLGNRIEEILQSPLQSIVINLVGHKPSVYGLISGRPLTEFVTILNHTQQLVQRRKALNAALEITLSMTVDVHNFKQIPEMIQFAEALGVDGLVLNNFIKTTKAGPLKTDRTLYRDQKAFVEFLQHIESTLMQSSRLKITLPRLVHADMSKHWYCNEPFTTIAVDAEFNVSGCSRQYLGPEPTSKVWDNHFFNNAMYKSLRNTFSTLITARHRPAVPMPCQHCPNNMPCLPKI